jgi:hypothetical protein
MLVKLRHGSKTKIIIVVVILRYLFQNNPDVSLFLHSLVENDRDIRRSQLKAIVCFITKISAETLIVSDASSPQKYNWAKEISLSSKPIGKINYQSRRIRREKNSNKKKRTFFMSSEISLLSAKLLRKWKSRQTQTHAHTHTHKHTHSISFSFSPH